MEANYVGPGWYWVENVVGPCFIEKDKDGWLLATRSGVRYNIGGNDKIITHIPRPAQRPVVDWSVMPAWAKWVAVDKSGTWCWYTDEPSINDRHYVVDNGIYGTIPREHAPTYTGDWKNSLVGRPE